VSDDVLRLGVSLPITWVNLTLDAATERDDVAQQVDDRIATEPELAPARAALMELCLGWAASARELGARMAAIRWDEDPAFGVAMATMLVFRLERSSSGPVEAELAALAGRLTEPLGNDQRPPVVDRVDVPIGQAMRVDAVRDPTPAGAPSEPLRSVIQYWIPVAGRADLLEIEATTANLALAPAIAEEVEAIVETMTLG
jgi:hypothetical protein